MKYVKVIIDNKSDSTDGFYTYGCQIDQVKVGDKVIVPFGRGDRPKEAYVFQVLDQPDQEYKVLKQVSSIDEEVALSQEIMETVSWMRRRYLCRYIDAIKVFTPQGKPSKTGKERQPYKDETGEPQHIDCLTDQQDQAIGQINMAIDQGEHRIFLLHGVTGSGKTEVYMQSVAKVIDQGKTAIMLVPEISLTPQIINRFIGRFGRENIAVLHSKLTQGERYDQWQKIKSGQVRIVIGARSALFAPVDNIGIIIIDEEHESTYKSDMTPKYESIEVAIYRAKKHGGIVLSGSATPSVVSYARAQMGIYTLLKLDERYNQVELPQVEVVDMANELRQGNRSVISNQLYKEMDQCLKSGQQVILFLNRRGYNTFVSCRDCGYVMKCHDCDISLTYHKGRDQCVCHYCGYKTPALTTCPDCGSNRIRYFGAGTEQVVETVEELFQDYTVARLDLDTTVRKGSLDKILRDFGKGKSQILAGTQLVAKGLDFRNVGLVGVISADVTLNIPDYRSGERAFQLITQAAGRAGRGDQVGRVVIQTYTPNHYAIVAAAAQDYGQFYNKEIELRNQLKYPPFGDIIQVTFAAATCEECLEIGEKWKNTIEEELTTGPIMGPHLVKGQGQKELEKSYILIKSGPNERNVFVRLLDQLKQEDKRRKYHVSVDVNPYSLWRS